MAVYFDKFFSNGDGTNSIGIEAWSHPDLDSSVVKVLRKDLSYTIALPYINPNNEDQIFNMHYSNGHNVLIIVPEAGGNKIITFDTDNIVYSVSEFQNVRNIKITDALVCQDCVDGEIKDISKVYINGKFGKDEDERVCEFTLHGFKDVTSDLFESGKHFIHGSTPIPYSLDIDIKTTIVDVPVWTASIKNMEIITHSYILPIMERPEMLNLSVIVNAEQYDRYSKRCKVTVYDNEYEIMYFFVKSITPDEVNNIRAFVDPKGRRYLIFVYNNVNIVIVNIDRKRICRYTIDIERSDAKYTVTKPDSISIEEVDFNSHTSRINIKTILHFDEDDCYISVDIVPKTEHFNDDIIDADMVVYFDKFADVPVMNKINDIYCSENFDIDVFTTGDIIGNNTAPLYGEGFIKDNNEEFILKIFDRVKKIGANVIDGGYGIIAKIDRERIGSLIDDMNDIIGKYGKSAED